MTFRKTLLNTLAAGAAALSLTACGAHPMPGLVGAAALAAGESSAMAKGATMTMYVMPEAGPAPVLNAIKSAKKSIQFELYMLTYSDISKQITDALIEKSKEKGVDVRVILEDHPYTPVAPGQDPSTAFNVNGPAMKALVAAGVRVAHSSPKFVYTHEKAMVVDGKTAYIMTMNMSSSAFTKNREYVIADTSPSDVAEVSKIFDADWEQLPIKPSDPDLVVSPDNSRARILGLIDRAKKSLVVESEFMDDPEMIQHIADAQNKRHCAVQVMLSFQKPSGDYDANGNESAAMTKAGITSFTFTHSITMHAKSVIVDGTAAYVGSENLTTNSLDHNREMGVIVTDPVIMAKLVSISSADWAANPPAAAPAAK